jgi:hypothetical protein
MVGKFDWLLGLARKAPKIVTGTVEKAQNEAYTHIEGVGVFRDCMDVGKQLVGNVQRELLPLPFPLPRKNTSPWHVIKSKKNARARLSVEREEDGLESLRVDYVPGAVGMSSGWGFHATPEHAFPTISSTLSYRVFFPEDFDWKRGGKLPGLFVGHPGATGGNWEYKAGSARVVWQRNGVAALYLYLPLQVAFDGSKEMAVDMQSQEFKRCCHVTNKGCHLWNKGPDVLRFKRGQWNDVQLVVHLNTIGQQDGFVELTVNGEKKVCGGMAWRTRAHLAIGGLVWQTFYGGSAPEAACPPQGAYTKFAEFKV